MTMSPEYSRAAAIISREAIAHNLDVVRVAANTDVMAVVKADAYGHGVDVIAPYLREIGVTWLGVALPSEGIALRESGDRGRVLAWLSTPGDPAIQQCVERDVDLSVSSLWELSTIADYAAASNRQAHVHLKIDTGLSRNGVLPRDLDPLLTELATQIDAGHINLRGVWSHLACADNEDLDYAVNTVQAQVDIFESALARIANHGLTPQVRHLAHSAGALWHPNTRYDLVRSGIALYGLSPNSVRASAASLGLVPAMSVEAKLAQVKVIEAGAGVSYSYTWRAKKSTPVGLVPLGYADGVSRNLSNRITPVVGGRRVPQIGTITMDQFVIDLTEIAASPGDVVTLFGSGAAGDQSADDWGVLSGTVGYEVVTRMGARLPRKYR